MTTTYAGIDYGRGQTNVNIQTGIRFGVIPSNSCNPDATEDIYQNGKDLDYEAYIDEAKAKLSQALSDYFNDYQHESGKPSKLDQAVGDAFKAISDDLSDRYEGTGDCTRMLYESDGYRIQTDGQGDLWVFESPFFTYAQFCSPCAPGACYLQNALDQPSEANKCYCLGHDWFDDYKAPYPVYSVETGELVNP